MPARRALTRLLDPGAAPASTRDLFSREYRAGSPCRIHGTAKKLAIRANVVGPGRLVHVRQRLGLGIARIDPRRIGCAYLAAGQQKRRGKGDHGRGVAYELTAIYLFHV